MSSSTESRSDPASSSSASSLADAQRIVDTLHEPLLVLDENLIVQQVNPAYYNTFSTTEEETVGRSLFELGRAHFDHPRLRAPLRALLTKREPFEEVELDHTFEGLGRRVLQINGRMLEADEGTSERVLLAINDVTEQHRLERDLRRHAKELERSNEELEQFAYAASHDLQEPLRMVSSYLQLLERRYRDELDDTAQEFIDYAVDGAVRMKALINGLLQYSRVGRKEGEFGTVDLNVIMDNILEDLDRRIEDLEGRVTCESLPTIYGNREQLRRLFQNLIENALTYHGDAPPRVHISGDETEGGGAHVVVRDEGPGIAEEAHEKIFQLFNQIDPHGTGREGSGIGLALCRKIAERHDGRIWVNSEPGRGASFHVTTELTPTDDS